MIKLIAFLKRRSDLTSEEFHEHWRNVHGPLIATTPDVARHIHRAGGEARRPDRAIAPVGQIVAAHEVAWRHFCRWFAGGDEIRTALELVSLPSTTTTLSPNSAFHIRIGVLNAAGTAFAAYQKVQAGAAYFVVAFNHHFRDAW